MLENNNTCIKCEIINNRTEKYKSLDKFMNVL